MSKKQIVNEHPKISIITLSRYITADTNKKETLLKKLKFSEVPLYARYSNPKSAINKYLKDKSRDILVYDEFIKKEKERVVDSSFKKIDQKCSLEALDLLKLKSANLLQSYRNYYSKKGLKKQFTHIYAEGVDVALSPDLVLYDWEEKKIKGFIKLNFSKNAKQRLSYQQGQLITGLIKEHLEEQFEVKFDRKLCVVFDIFSSRIIYAPLESTWIKDRPKTKKAYKEIAEVWPFLKSDAA